jgi:hypothetical protein
MAVQGFDIGRCQPAARALAFAAQPGRSMSPPIHALPSHAAAAGIRIPASSRSSST